MFKLGTKRKIGGKLNSIILRSNFLSSLDRIIEYFFPIFPKRDVRRYKSFIGNFLITQDKVDTIVFLFPEIRNASKIIDIGSADGSILYRIGHRFKIPGLYGYDSGYGLNGEFNLGNACSVSLHDINLYHAYYNRNGTVDPRTVDLKLAKEADLIYMFDVLPYLDEPTIENYFAQISGALRTSGAFLITARVDEDNFNLVGKGGEFHQKSRTLSYLLKVAEEHDLKLVKFIYGGWKWKSGETISFGADLLLFQRK